MKTQVARPLLAAILAGSTIFATVPPGFAQQPGQDLPSAPAPQAASATTPPSVSLGVAKYNFQHAPKAFPNLIAPYKPIEVAQPVLANSPRIDQLVKEGKLELTLQDAIELALENSLDIAVQRYYPWLADAGILKTQAGSAFAGGGTPGAAFGGSTASINSVFYDPSLSAVVGYDYRSTPVNNPFISGIGTGAGSQSTVVGLISHTAFYDFAYSEGFSTGTSFTVAWDNQRSSSSSSFNFFNPSLQSSLTVGFQQQLLNGFGTFVNRRNLLIAKNNRKIADFAFAQQAINTITAVITDYWELAYARENVRVSEQAVAVSEKLYNDNKKQLEIGTMAPLDVTRAESELATDRQNLIVAQTRKLQQEQILKNAISKDPLAQNLINVEIIPADKPNQSEMVEAASFQEAIQEAFAKRPDLQEQALNLKNSDIDVRATRNALLPTASISGQYGSFGLAGNSVIPGKTTTVAGLPVVDVNGNPVTVSGPNNTQVPIFAPVTRTASAGINKQGFTDAQSQIFHNQFPDYSVQFNLQIPLRNRAAQADNQRALLTQRQFAVEMQQLKNNALLDVRNTYIALEQDRARVDAAIKARQLQQQTFEAEQKKYQLGASTVYQVILTQRDYVAAQGTELRALADLEEAKANYQRAVGRTLEVNHVTIADAKSGHVEPETLIPGTLHGKVVGTDELFRDLPAGSR
jgi:outer membrane protein TolC